MFAPRSDGTFGFCRFTPDETNEDVEAADGKEEKGRDESEGVDAVRQNSCTDPVGPGQ